MRITCPGNTAAPIALWDVCGAMTIEVLLTEPEGDGRARNTTDGRMPHLLYRVGNAGAAHKQLSQAQIGSFRGSQPDTDKVWSVEFDCGTHHLPWAGAIYLVGGDPTVEVDIALFEHPPTGRVDGFQWPSDQKTATLHTLTTLISAAGTTRVPNYHTEIGGWVTRAGTLLQGQAVTLDHTTVSCVPGSVVSNPAGANLMIFTGVRF